jgi:small-conductance mechanosensitive channel
MGTLAVALAAVNVFGGFLVTRRMLEMFKKKTRTRRRSKHEHESGNDALPDRVDLLHPGPQRPVAPDHSRRGNLFGMLGMALAILTTVGLIYKLGAELATAGIGYVIVGLLIGGTAGSIMAKRVEMTKMPELVAFMHSMIGLAAVFIAIAAVVEPQSLGIVKHGRFDPGR